MSVVMVQLPCRDFQTYGGCQAPHAWQGPRVPAEGQPDASRRLEGGIDDGGADGRRAGRRQLVTEDVLDEAVLRSGEGGALGQATGRVLVTR